MLLLGLKKEEQIVITTPKGRVTITLARIGDGRVHLGFEGPVEIPIHRKHIQDKIDRDHAAIWQDEGVPG